MCDVEKLEMGLTCDSPDEDVGVGYKDNIVWICKVCFNKIVNQPWPWDVVEKDLNKTGHLNTRGSKACM